MYFSPKCDYALTPMIRSLKLDDKHKRNSWYQNLFHYRVVSCFQLLLLQFLVGLY